LPSFLDIYTQSNIRNISPSISRRIEIRVNQIHIIRMTLAPNCVCILIIAPYASISTHPIRPRPLTYITHGYTPAGGHSLKLFGINFFYIKRRERENQREYTRKSVGAEKLFWNVLLDRVVISLCLRWIGNREIRKQTREKTRHSVVYSAVYIVAYTHTSPSLSMIKVGKSDDSYSGTHRRFILHPANRVPQPTAQHQHTHWRDRNFDSRAWCIDNFGYVCIHTLYRTCLSISSSGFISRMDKPIKYTLEQIALSPLYT
jgi:hypothetical protein